MKRIILLFTFLFSSNLLAETYHIDKVTRVYTSVNCNVLIKWTGAPRPSPTCGGENHGWARIESTADNALKSFAYMLYTTGLKAAVITNN